MERWTSQCSCSLGGIKGVSEIPQAQVTKGKCNELDFINRKILGQRESEPSPHSGCKDLGIARGWVKGRPRGAPCSLFGRSMLASGPGG